MNALPLLLAINPLFQVHWLKLTYQLGFNQGFIYMEIFAKLLKALTIMLAKTEQHGTTTRHLDNKTQSKNETQKSSKTLRILEAPNLLNLASAHVPMSPHDSNLLGNNFTK
jgi:hypothetical protein